MNRFWKFFRFGVLTVAFILLGLYLFGSTNWAKLFGHLPTYAQWIKEGQPVAQAIYHFKAERGLWPEYLDELVPDYLSPEQFKQVEKQEWEYTLVQRDGRPGLSRRIREMHRTHVGYDFEPEKPSWIVFGDEEKRLLQIMSPPSFPPLPHDQLVSNQFAELDRRIRRSSGQIVMEYRRQQISLLLSEGREAEARSRLAETQRLNTHHFWPRLATVKLDLQQQTGWGGGVPAGTQGVSLYTSLPPSFADFAAWVKADPTFTHWYYLSQAYRWAGLDSEALAAVVAASNLPAAATPNDFEITAFYLWDMSRFALQHKQWNLVLKLAEAWSQLPEDFRRVENSYLALSAAAKLGKGDVAGEGGAKADMQSLRESKLATWAKNLDMLEDAIKRDDRTFQYDPGDKPEFKLFELPQ